MNVIMAEGYREITSLDTTKRGRLCSDSRCLNTYEVKVRALAAKFPGMQMTTYRTADLLA